MNFNLQHFADGTSLPAFGLMTRADKQKLDAIATDTLLTKTAASDTYATKIALKNYLANVIESDTGVAFLNGNGEIMLLVPKMGGGTVNKQDPQLTASPESFEYDSSGKFTPQEITVTRLGNGTITAEVDNNLVTAEVEGNTITVSRIYQTPAGNFKVTIKVAETAEYTESMTTVQFTDIGEIEPAE